MVCSFRAENSTCIRRVQGKQRRRETSAATSARDDGSARLSERLSLALCCKSFEINAGDSGSTPARRWTGECIVLPRRTVGQDMMRFESNQIQFFLKSIQGILREADPATFQLISVSDQAESILGYSREAWLSDDFWISHMHPEDAVGILEACWKATAEGLNHELEYRMISGDGRTVWFRDTVFVEMYQGQPIRLRGIMIDITEQKRLESEIQESKEALQASAQLLQLLASSAKDAIFRYTICPLACEYMSPAVTEITGYTPREYYDDPSLAAKVIHPKDRRLLALPELIKSSGQLGVIRLIRKDGEVLWMEHRTIAIFDDYGSVVAIEGIARDVTERIKLQKELSQAQRMESMGRLAGGVAHDFNNLLTVILGYTQSILQQMHIEDPLRREIEAIQYAGERGALLTRQLLTIGRQQPLPSVLDLKEVIEQTKGLLKRVVGKKIRLSFNLSPEDARVRIDVSQIEQVILNLVINARDAMPRGGTIAIEISARG